MKATEQYFPAVLFIMLYKKVLTFLSADQILQCDHSNKRLYKVVLWPFKWKLSSNTFLCHWLFFRILQNEICYFSLTLSLPESIMETCSVVLTFMSVDKIPRCDNSNETSSAVLLHGTICFSLFYKMESGNFREFWCLALLGIKGLSLNLAALDN